MHSFADRARCPKLQHDETALVMGIASASSSPLDSNDSMPRSQGVCSPRFYSGADDARPTWSTAPTISPRQQWRPHLQLRPWSRTTARLGRPFRLGIEPRSRRDEVKPHLYVGHILGEGHGALVSRDYFWGWSFNEDIAWDTSGVTAFTYMFFGLESFNRRLQLERRQGNEHDRHVPRLPRPSTRPRLVLKRRRENDAAFEKTKCESTWCGFSYKDVIGNCEVVSSVSHYASALERPQGMQNQLTNARLLAGQYLACPSCKHR